MSDKIAKFAVSILVMTASRFKRSLVTAALPYANGPVHIGHLAGCYLPADIYARHLRSRGEDVLFVCGSDEHGVPITIKAAKEGITPQQVVDKYHAMMRDAFAGFGISFDIYSRTSNAIHHETASEFFRTLYDKGVFTEEVTEQYYDESAAQFLADRYITGTCPKCGHAAAYGDQCEKCGVSLNPTDLIHPRSVLSGNTPVLRKTLNWFLPLDKMQPMIDRYIESHADWKANVYGQCRSWLNQGLQPRAMTRDLNWGVKVPLPDAEGKVLYVWFDAPIGYISAMRELRPDTWQDYWRDPETRLIHFIGKDNIVFHCIIFPAMLMAEGSYIVADNVPANEFLNLEGEKISTSRNWAVWLHEYLADFPGRQDELRYVLTSIAPETKDSDFTWKDYQARVNNELADILGNYVKRVVDLVHRFCGGKVPAHHNLKVLGEAEEAAESNEYMRKEQMINESMDAFRFREAQALMMDIARQGNQYLQKTEPWKRIKVSAEEVDAILCSGLQTCVLLARMMVPFLPHTSARLCRMLNIPEDPTLWDEGLRKGHLLAGHPIGISEILFVRVEDAAIEAQVARLTQAASQRAEPVKAGEEKGIAAPKQETGFDDFMKMDLRVGTILEAERVKGADKLLKLLVDTGVDRRTVVSGIAEYYAPENIIGQQVTILLNLHPKKIRGIESKGMILMAEDADGKLSFVAPDRLTGNGSTVR
jgi:methionyl-tRNA synthetase